MYTSVLISNTEEPISGNHREFLLDPLLVFDCEFLTSACREGQIFEELFIVVYQAV